MQYKNANSDSMLNCMVWYPTYLNSLEDVFLEFKADLYFLFDGRVLGERSSRNSKVLETLVIARAYLNPTCC